MSQKLEKVYNFLDPLPLTYDNVDFFIWEETEIWFWTFLFHTLMLLWDFFNFPLFSQLQDGQTEGQMDRLEGGTEERT